MLKIDQNAVEILNRLSASGSNELDLAINYALRQVGEICGFDRTYIFLLRDGEFLDNSHEWAAPGIMPMIDVLQNLPMSLVPHWFDAFAADEIIYISSVKDLPDGDPEKETLEAQDIKSLVVVPMVGEAQLIGFMGYDAVVAERDFNEREVFFLRSVASGITALFLRSRALSLAYAAAEKERDLAQQAMDARLRLDIAINALPDGFVIYDNNKEITLCNKKFHELNLNDILASEEQGISANISANHIEVGLEGAVSNVDLNLLGRPDPDGFEVQLTDGRWIRIVERPIPGGGLVGMHIDVTALKQAEQRLSQVIDGAQVGTWEWNVETGECNFNNRWAEMLGLALKDISPTTIETWTQLSHPDDIVVARDKLEKVLNGTEYEFEFEIRMRHKAGYYIWVLSRGRVVQKTKSDRPLVMAGVHIDITEQMKREQNLLATNQRLQKALHERDDAKNRFSNVEEASSDWFWEQNQNLEFTYISKSYELTTKAKYDQCIGLTIAELVQSGVWLDGDVDWIEYKTKLVEHKPFQNLTFEIPLSKKASIWVRLSGVPFHDSKGNFLGYRGVGSDVTSLFNAEAQARDLVTRDPLTGLINRSTLLGRLSDLLLAETSGDIKAAVLLIDIDNFKSINNSMGYHTGDLLLKLFGQKLLRKIQKKGVVARINADRFAVILTRKFASEVEGLAKEFVSYFAKSFVVDGRDIFITTSAGVYLVTADMKNAMECIKNAETALYYAKSTGRGKYTVFDIDLGDAQSRRSEMTQALHRALSQDCFRIVLQPQFTLEPTLALVGVEVLLRWNDPVLGDVPPSTFIDIAESIGLMVDLDLMVINKSCEMISNFLVRGHRIRVAVNISAQSFQQPGFVAQLLGLLQKHNVPAELFKIEITETTLMSQTEDTFEKLHRLEEKGIQFAIDDFGTGYSSLSYLQQLPIVELKIDRSFVGRLACNNPKSEAIVAAILSMAQELGLSCIAEGVETEAQLAWLKGRHCHAVQGYLLSRPIEMDYFLTNYLVH